jgi:hypothetical protein
LAAASNFCNSADLNKMKFKYHLLQEHSHYLLRYLQVTNSVSMNFYNTLKGLFVVFILYDPLIHKLILQLKEQIVEDLEP